MCELIFINSHRADLNRMIAVHVALEDTRTLNQHGWGIFTAKTGIKKTNVIPWLTPGFGDILRDSIDKEPVLMHVRSASKDTEIKPEFNHPFETERLVLAHNGTLAPKEELSDYKDKLDSEVFLLELDKEYVANKKDLVLALQTTMERFTGKFAFLIYEKRTGEWYAVRGRTADLHVCYFLTDEDEPKSIGYVINTVLNDLGWAVATSLNALIMLGKSIPVMSKVEELKQETIFHLTPAAPVIVGKIEQNTKPVPVTPPVTSRFVDGRWRDDDDDLPLFPMDGHLADLDKWMNTYGISLEELDLLMVESIGVPLLCCEEVDIKTLQNHVIKRLQCPNWARKDYLKLVRENGSYWMPEVYKKGFQFPYILEPKKRDLLKEMHKVIDSKAA